MSSSLRLSHNSCGLGLLHFQTCKSPQIYRIHVRDSPEFESIMFPMQNVIAIFDKTLPGCTAAGFRRPDEQVDNMLITLVNEGRYFPTIKIIQTASNQAEAMFRIILNRRGEFKLSVEPGFNRMLIGRRHIEQVRGEQGAKVTGHHFVCERVTARAINYCTLIEEN